MASRPIVLIGLSGSGKSSVGSELATRLNRPFVDLDQRIEGEAGKPIAAVFADDGEARFRQLEAKALAGVLAAEPAPVVAGGGGLVLAEPNRRLLADRALVVWIDAPVDVVRARLTGTTDRPLLEGDLGQRLAQLRRDRLGFYTVCADVIVTDSGEPVDVMAGSVERELADHGEALDALGVRTERFDFGDERSYDVLIGRGAADLLPDLIPSGVRRVAIVTQDGIDIDVDPGVEHRVFVVEDGEQAKRLDVVGDLASQLARWGMTRRDAIVSVGGGVVSDLAGYLAASYHRGVPVVHVSTTLLGQIDAAIGGKCGVNLPEGKNLLGAFKQPAGVICDTSHLATLPPAEFLSGMGELAKYHFLGGGRLDELPLTERVAAGVRIKADVVVDDELEGGRRAILNYGHTLAHAIETVTDYRVRHGEAVAVGLVYAAELANALGRIDEERVAEHRRVVDAYCLDGRLPAGLDPEELVQLFGRDKKAVDGTVFVLDGPGGVEPVPVDDDQLLRDTLERLDQ